MLLKTQPVFIHLCIVHGDFQVKMAKFSSNRSFYGAQDSNYLLSTYCCVGKQKLAAPKRLIVMRDDRSLSSSLFLRNIRFQSLSLYLPLSYLKNVERGPSAGRVLSPQISIVRAWCGRQGGTLQTLVAKIPHCVLCLYLLSKHLSARHLVFHLYVELPSSPLKSQITTHNLLLCLQLKIVIKVRVSTVLESCSVFLGLSLYTCYQIFL